MADVLSVDDLADDPAGLDFFVASELTTAPVEPTPVISIAFKIL